MISKPALRFSFFVAFVFTLICFMALQGRAQEEYFNKSLSAWFTYNQYAPAGTLPVQLGGTADTQISGLLYNISGVDITAQPVNSPDGKFKMPMLTFSGRTGLKLYIPLAGIIHPYVLGDVGLSGSAQWIIGNFTGGGGADLQFKPNWAIPVEFRAIAHQGQQANYMVSFGLKYLLKKK
jgi:hypothetical protein